MQSHLLPRATRLAKSLRLCHYIPRWLYRLVGEVWGRLLARRGRQRATVKVNLHHLQPHIAASAVPAYTKKVCISAALAQMELLYTGGSTFAEMTPFITEIDDPDQCLAGGGSSAAGTIFYYGHGPFLDYVVWVLHKVSTPAVPGMLLVNAPKSRIARALWKDRQYKHEGTVDAVWTDISGLRAIRKTLGRGGAVAAATDLTTQAGNSIASTLFGQPIYMPSLWHKIQQQTGAQPLWIWVERLVFLRSYRLCVRTMPVAAQSPDPNVYAAAINRQLEQVIARLGPDYWYWLYRRLRRQPGGAGVDYRAHYKGGGVLK